MSELVKIFSSPIDKLKAILKHQKVAIPRTDNAIRAIVAMIYYNAGQITSSQAVSYVTNPRFYEVMSKATSLEDGLAKLDDKSFDELPNVLKNLTLDYLEPEEAYVYNLVTPSAKLAKISASTTPQKTLEYIIERKWIEGYTIIEPMIKAQPSLFDIPNAFHLALRNTNTEMIGRLYLLNGSKLPLKTQRILNGKTYPWNFDVSSDYLVDIMLYSNSVEIFEWITSTYQLEYKSSLRIDRPFNYIHIFSLSPLDLIQWFLKYNRHASFKDIKPYIITQQRLAEIIYERGDKSIIDWFESFHPVYSQDEVFTGIVSNSKPANLKYFITKTDYKYNPNKALGMAHTEAMIDWCIQHGATNIGESLVSRAKYGWYEAVKTYLTKYRDRLTDDDIDEAFLGALQEKKFSEDHKKILDLLSDKVDLSEAMKAYIYIYNNKYKDEGDEDDEGEGDEDDEDEDEEKPDINDSEGMKYLQSKLGAK